MEPTPETLEEVRELYARETVSESSEEELEECVDDDVEREERGEKELEEKKEEESNGVSEEVTEGENGVVKEDLKRKRGNGDELPPAKKPRDEIKLTLKNVPEVSPGTTKAA